MSKPTHEQRNPSRRDVLAHGLSAAALVTLPVLPAAAQSSPAANPSERTETMENRVTTQDGVDIYYKDWGAKDRPVIAFHHGWPLSSDDWDNQMLFFLANGYRVVAHDRRGHGRSTQVSEGNDMDHYAADANAVYEHLGLKNVIHIGHSTGGGEVARYISKYGIGNGLVSKAVLISSVPPIMVKSASNPEGTPISAFDGLRAQLAANRAVFYHDLAAGPFYSFNRPGEKVIEPIVDNWVRQGMMGGAQPHYEGIKAFSETDFTEDLKAIDVPVLCMQGTDDQIVPYKDASVLQVKLLKEGTLKLYDGWAHGMFVTHADVINPELLSFIKS